MSIALYRVTYKGKEVGSGKKMRVVGSALTYADALAEANSKLALTVMAVDSASSTQVLAAGDMGTPATGTYTDAELIVQKVGEPDRVIHLENVTTTLFDGITGRMLVPPPAALLTFIDSWSDGKGDMGYSFKEGYAVN